MSRIDRLKKNIFSTLVYAVVTFVCGFVLPRLFLSHYGSAVNGLISSINHFLNFVSLGDMGVGAVITANLYIPLAQKNHKALDDLLRESRSFYQKLALVIAVYVIVLMFVLSVLMKGTFSVGFVSLMVLIISITSFTQYYFGITYTLLLLADQHQYVYMVINGVTLILSTFISVICIINNCPVWQVKLFSALIFAIRPFALMLYVKKHYPFLTNRKGKAKNVIKQKWNGMAQHVASIVQENIDIVILTVFQNVITVSVYSIYYLITNSVRSLIYATSAGMSSLIGDLLAKDEKDQLKKTFAEYEWFVHTESVLIFTVTASLIVPFLSVYTKGIQDANYLLPEFGMVMCLAGAIRCFQLPYTNIVQAANHFKQTQICFVFEPIINIVFSLLLLRPYGLIGVAWGTVISLLFREIFLVIYLKKHILFLDIWEFVRQSVIDVISAVVMYFTVRIFRFQLHELSYVSWIMLAMKIFVLCFLECLLINFLFRQNKVKAFFQIIKGKFNVGE